LCVWLGPRLACSLLFVIGVGTVWFLACPTLADRRDFHSGISSRPFQPPLIADNGSGHRMTINIRVKVVEYCHCLIDRIEVTAK
jgi:hypothetical protein